MKIYDVSAEHPSIDLISKHSKHTYHVPLNDADLIFVGSVTQWRNAIGHKVDTGLPMVCHVWDIPSNWRLWCRNEQDYLNNKHRDVEIVRMLDFLGLCDLVIACSEHTQTVLYTLGIKSTVLHNFYDVEEIDACLENVKIEKKNRIIQISRYALNKRFHTTLEMWGKLKDKYKDWELMFIGPKGDIWNEIKDVKMDRVTIHSELNRKLLVTLMAEARILVSPSLNEGFGLTPIEARHLGLDVVCSDMPWVHEFRYATTKAFEPDNVDAYCESIESVISSPIGFSEKPSHLTVREFADRFDKLIDKEIK